MAVMLLAFEKRDHRRMAVLLGLAAFVGMWAAHAFEGATNRTLLTSAYLLTACFFGFALSGIVRTILVGRATTDAILGAICGYLLLGIIWSLLYAAVETAAPGSFAVEVRGREATRPDRSMLSYYSFVTLSTVGYGDVTPTTPLTRTMAWIEAVAGQFYLAVLVAGLVGFKVSQSQLRKSSARRGEDRD
jgi:hypothetical protein